MNPRFVLYALGKLLVILSGIMCIPAGIAFFEIHPQPFPDVFFHENLMGFIIAIISSYLCGSLFILTGTKTTGGNKIREGFAIVTFGWLVLTFFGSIPLFVYFVAHSSDLTLPGLFLCFTNACFENMSGFTTTGATILTDVEIVPKGLLFWRSMTHWLGGMGIVTLALAIFPAFGVAAYQMFRGEAPGPTTERVTPRLAQTAKVLWGVYALLTFIETALLIFGGMSVFDAFCHSFGTMATGGFSTKNASIGAYNSAYIEWVIIVFMFFAGMNFMIHFRVLFTRTLRPLRRNREFHFYIGVIFTGLFICAVLLRVIGIVPISQIKQHFRHSRLSENELVEKNAVEQEKIRTIHDTIRRSAFQVISLTTTTGYCTADFDVWPNSIRFMLVVLMFFGGCAGSTGGGIKMIRIMTIFKTAWREVKTMIQPRLISPIKVAGKPVEEKLVANIIGFVTLFILLFVLFSAIMCLFIPDVTTAVSSVVSTMCNIGPGLSGVGATQNYAWIPVTGKWILMLCMLLGRLEIYTVLIAFVPVSLKKRY